MFYIFVSKYDNRWTTVFDIAWPFRSRMFLGSVQLENGLCQKLSSIYILYFFVNICNVRLRFLYITFGSKYSNN